MVSAGLEVICYHIVYKTCLSGIDAGFSTTLCPFCHANGEHALVFLAEEHSLYVGTLTLPGMDGCGILLLQLGYIVQGVVLIARSP